MDIIYDVETFPNCFTLTAMHADIPALVWQFEISDRRNDSVGICNWVRMMYGLGARMVGFNNVGFDYPILHMILVAGNTTAEHIYNKCQAIIGSQDADRWGHIVYASDRRIPQIDLFLIHHFDNRARATSLKELEFNMRMDNICDLPFPVGSRLTRGEVDVLKQYNLHDVKATREFYHHSRSAIQFREQLAAKHGKVDWLNFNDTKIGKQFFQMQLENAGVQCYDYSGDGRSPRQTPREPIVLKDAILPSVSFTAPEFNRALDFLKGQEIYQTKGLFDGLSATVNGFEFVFGLGGIHGSVSNKKIVSDGNWVIRDIDVTSYYPMLAIKNRFFPEHLGEKFCDIYQQLFEERRKHKKKSTENEMLKLALNGVYGDSNNPYGIFYDPLYTMKTTLNGQFLLCMLAEQVMHLGELVQVNTDGMTIRLLRDNEERFTGLSLEKLDYSRMWVADVNNYLAEGVDGRVKGKGRYHYEGDWSRNHSAMVVPKVTERVLLDTLSIRRVVETWPDKMDFMLRVKINRGSRLVDHTGKEYQRITRYYVAKGGVELFKMMPPLPGKGPNERKFAIEAGRTVCVCNDIRDAVLPIDFDYYVGEVEKLVIVLQ